MIIQCDKCATKFRLDDSKVTANGVKVRCTKCDNVFIVTPPPAPEEAQVEELFNGLINDEQRPAPAAAGFQARAQAPKPKADNRHLAFDFDSSVTREDIFNAGEKPAGQDSGPKAGLRSDEEDPGKKFSLDDLDFSFSSDPAEEEKKETGLAGDALFGNAPEETSANGFQAGPGGEGASKEENSELDFNFDDLSGGDSEKSAGWPEEEKEEPIGEPEPQKPVMAENVIPFQAAAYNKEAKAPAAKAADDEAEKEEAFKAVLSKTIERDREEVFSFAKPVEDVDDEMPEDEDDAPRRPHSKMGLIVAALVIVLGGGLIYFTGVIDKLASLIMPPASSELKVVEIESVKGFYEENRNFGKVFVIDARVKNITGEPQEIKAATGIIYNDDGEKIGEKSVSPGRIVSIDDVRNLQKEELERAFRDPSGGMIPAKGSVPVMVLFVDIPQGLSEFGLDIVR